MLEYLRGPLGHRFRDSRFPTESVLVRSMACYVDSEECDGRRRLVPLKDVPVSELATCDR